MYLKFDEKVFFLQWRNCFYHNTEPLSVSDLESVSVLEETAGFLCCDRKFTNTARLLLHVSEHEDSVTDSVRCETCHFSLKGINKTGGLSWSHMFDMLEQHLLSKAHLNNSMREDKIPCDSSVCDVCNVHMGESDISSHIGSEDHRNNVVIVMEYLQFCKARNLDPVNHQEFQDFIFFLRYIHSMSINLKRPIRTTMQIVSNIHSHFNNLLNVNESIDVTDEVIDKLSATDPAVLFCFLCRESFLTCDEAAEHLSVCTAVRCVVCRIEVNTEVDTEVNSLRNHKHQLQLKQVTLEEAPELENNEQIDNCEKENELTSDSPSDNLKKVELEKVSVGEYRTTVNLPFNSQVQEDCVEKVKFDVSLGDILSSTKNKTIVDHCVEKRKFEEEDPASTQYPLSWIKYMKLRMNLNLNIEKCDWSDDSSDDVQTNVEAPFETPKEEDNYQMSSVKMEPVESVDLEITPENYKQLDFDVSLTDIALTSEWRKKLEPQILFLKRKAEVFNRWKNDINFYFNSSSQ